MANTTLITQVQANLQKEFLEQDFQRLAQLNKQLESESSTVTQALRQGIVVDSSVPRGV